MVRYTFSDESLSEKNAHLESLFEREQQLAREFVRDELKPFDGTWHECPVSGEARNEVFFEKWGQAYAYDPRTWTLSLAQFPSAEVTRRYWHESPLAQFRASSAYQNSQTQSRGPLLRVHPV